MLHLIFLFFLVSLYEANVVFPTQPTPLHSKVATTPFSMSGDSAKFFYVDVPAGAVSFSAQLQLPPNVNSDEIVFRYRPWVPSPVQITDATTPNIFHSYPIPANNAPIFNPAPGRYFITLFNTLSTEVTGLVLTVNVTDCMLATQSGQYCVDPQPLQKINQPFPVTTSTSAIQPFDRPLWIAPFEVMGPSQQAFRSLTFTVKMVKMVNITEANEQDAWPQFVIAYGGPAYDSNSDIRQQGLVRCVYEDFTVVNNAMTCVKSLDYPKNGLWYFSVFLPASGPSISPPNQFELTAEIATNDQGYPFNFVYLNDNTDFLLNKKSLDTVFYFDVPANSMPVVSLLGCPRTYDSEQNQDLQMSITLGGVSFQPAIPDVQLFFAEEWESAKPYPYWYLGSLAIGRYYFRITGVGSGEYQVKRHFGEAPSLCLDVPAKPKPPRPHDDDSNDTGADAGLVVLYILASCCFCAACLSLIGVAVGLVVTYRQALLAKYGELTGKYVAIGEKKNLYDDL